MSSLRAEEPLSSAQRAQTWLTRPDKNVSSFDETIDVNNVLTRTLNKQIKYKICSRVRVMNRAAETQRVHDHAGYFPLSHLGRYQLVELWLKRVLVVFCVANPHHLLGIPIIITASCCGCSPTNGVSSPWHNLYPFFPTISSTHKKM